MIFQKARRAVSDVARGERSEPREEDIPNTRAPEGRLRRENIFHRNPRLPLNRPSGALCVYCTLFPGLRRPNDGRLRPGLRLKRPFGPETNRHVITVDTNRFGPPANAGPVEGCFGISSVVSPQ